MLSSQNNYLSISFLSSEPEPSDLLLLSQKVLPAELAVGTANLCLHYSTKTVPLAMLAPNPGTVRSATPTSFFMIFIRILVPPTPTTADVLALGAVIVIRPTHNTAQQGFLPSFIVAGLGKLEDQKEIGQRIGPGEEGNQAGLGWAFSRKQKATEAAASSGGNHGRWSLGTAGDAVAAAALQSAAPQQCQTDKQIDWPWAEEEKAKKAEKTRRQKKRRRKQECREAREKRGEKSRGVCCCCCCHGHGGGKCVADGQPAAKATTEQQQQIVWAPPNAGECFEEENSSFSAHFGTFGHGKKKSLAAAATKPGTTFQPTNSLLFLGFSPPEFCCCQTTNTGEYRRRIFHQSEYLESSQHSFFLKRKDYGPNNFQMNG